MEKPVYMGFVLINYRSKSINHDQMGIDNFDLSHGGQSKQLFELNFIAHEGHVYAISEIFHRLAKDGVIHQFIEVSLKVRRRLSSLVRVKLYVGLHPRMLGKFENTMNVFQSHSQTSVKLVVHVVGYVFRFIVEIWHEFFRQNVMIRKRLGV